VLLAEADWTEISPAVLAAIAEGHRFGAPFLPAAAAGGRLSRSGPRPALAVDGSPASARDGA
jgi:hypothetical protein